MDRDAWRRYAERLDIGDVSVVYDMLLSQIGGKWGMYLPLPDPAVAEPEGALFLRQGLRTYCAAGAIAEPVKAVVTIEPGEVWLPFDPNRPIEPQLEHARQFLEGRGNRGQSRLRADKLPLYLRVLDGKAAGAKSADIARELFPGRPDGLSEVNKYRRKGERYRDEDYRKLMV